MSTDRSPNTDARTKKKGVKLSPKQIIGLVILLLVAIFCAQNTGRTEIRFFGAEIDSPLWVWLLGVLAIGTLVGILLPFGRKHD